jgi:hypothetical protein
VCTTHWSRGFEFRSEHTDLRFSLCSLSFDDRGLGLADSSCMESYRVSKSCSISELIVTHNGYFRVEGKGAAAAADDDHEN